VLMTNRVRVVALVAALLLSACQSQPRWEPHQGPTLGAYPGEIWAKAAAPEDLGWSSSALAEARRFSEAIGSTAMMVIQDGVVVDAWGEVAVESNLHSVRKSLLGALIGIAVEEGQIDLSATMAELQIDDNDPSLTEIEKQAKVGDLIKARSGVYHPALYQTPGMTASKLPRGSHGPGTYWHYNNWDFNALGTIYEQQSGEPIFEAFESRIGEPLQMEDFEAGDGEYRTGDRSIHRAYPFRMSARDLARFALLYLHEGRWRDEQVVSAAWVAESTASHSDVGPEKGYGYMWWTGWGEGFYPNVRVSGVAYYAAGYHGQFAFVFPDLDLVVVHRVNTDWSEANPTRRQIGRLLWLILSAGGGKDIGPDPGTEAARGDRLDADGLRETLTGSTVPGTSRSGAPWRVTYQADGTLAGVAGRADQHRDNGTWRIVGDRYCRQWTVWSGGREICFAVVRDGKVLSLFDLTGTFRGTATLAEDAS